MWSRPTLVIAATPPCQTFVASSRPPRPTSMTPTSTRGTREPEEGGRQVSSLELGRRAVASLDRSAAASTSSRTSAKSDGAIGWPSTTMRSR